MTTLSSSVLWHVTASLDGFIADADGEIDWAFGHGTPGDLADDAIARTGAVLAGRRCYDQGVRVGEGPKAIYGGGWSGPMLVLTHRPPAAAVDGVTFVSTDVTAAVETARYAAGGRAVGIFGASVARQCLSLGLIDEIIVHVAPVLVGGGTRLFDADGRPPVVLEVVEAQQRQGITNLRYRVRR